MEKELRNINLPAKAIPVSDSLSNSDLLTIIGLIIALAAYIATVRGRILDKASAAKAVNDHPRKEELKKYAKQLMFADVPLIISGLMLITYITLKIFASTTISVLLNVGISFFAFALIVLTLFHGYEWYKSFKA